MSYLASWSGGKDGCLACYKAMQAGYDVSFLVNFVSEEHNRVRFHGTEAELIRLQGQSIGLPVFQKKTAGDRYEEQFKEAVAGLIPKGIEGMIFGDIYLQEHRDWVERVCGELGIEAIEPLWGRRPAEVLAEFIDCGFKAVVVSGQGEIIEPERIGCVVDADFIRYAERLGMDVCGENGEYHTVVVDGPIFAKPIKIVEAETVKINGYWFLDTKKYELAADSRND